MKRFTETDKWRDPWFRKLSAGAKLAFYYIVENCDNAGVWTPDKELADFSIGMPIPWDKVLEAFGNRIEILSSGDWLVRKFVDFQFGKLSEACKPHLQVIRLIEKHRVSKGYPKGIDTLKEKEKEKDKEGGSAEGGKTNKAKCSVSDAEEYCASISLPKSDGQWFVDKCEGSGWKNGGEPIKDWKATIRAWKTAGYMASQKGGNGTGTKHVPTQNLHGGATRIV